MRFLETFAGLISAIKELISASFSPCWLSSLYWIVWTGGSKVSAIRVVHVVAHEAIVNRQKVQKIPW